MKNANVFVDVDLTLIDANGKIRPGAAVALARLKDKGCHLFLWSTNGADYSRKVARINGLEELFEASRPSPTSSLTICPERL
jgi:hydroxymethylpyrimidine pyrophosphatase-like HAD family hydrolase